MEAIKNMTNSSDTPQQAQEQSQHIGMSDAGDTRYWHAHTYANPHDPKSIVPKNNGRGSSINFSHPQAKVMVGAFLIAILPILIIVAIIALTHH
jgi:uncharacterized membrane protein